VPIVGANSKIPTRQSKTSGFPKWDSTSRVMS
jgi:hypothetical protein